MAKLYFRYSAMNAGKSTALLQVAHNYEEQGQVVRLYTAAIDHRYGPGKVTSRLGPQREAEVFDSEFNFLEAAPQVSCVLIDEAQFLTAQQVRQLHQLAQVKGVPVICYGLRSDFLGEPFPGGCLFIDARRRYRRIKKYLCMRKKSHHEYSSGCRWQAGETRRAGGDRRQ